LFNQNSLASETSPNTKFVLSTLWIDSRLFCFLIIFKPCPIGKQP